MAGPVTIVVVGAGSRGTVSLESYAERRELPSLT
jgi:hypothetical protein